MVTFDMTYLTYIVICPMNLEDKWSIFEKNNTKNMIDCIEIILHNNSF